MNANDEKEVRRRGQVIRRGPDAYLIRVPTARDPVTGRRTYHNETFRGTRPKAEKRCAAICAQVADGSFFQPSEMTVNELLDRWLSHVRRKGLRPSSLDNYEYKLKQYVRPELGRVPLARLTSLSIQEVFDRLVDRGLAPLTVRNARSVFSYALTYAVRHGLLKTSPLAGVETPKATRRPKRAMTEVEAAHFIECARKDPEGLIFVLWLYTGLRPEEFFGLKWADLELAREEDSAYGVLHVARAVVRVKGGGWQFYDPKTEKGKRSVYFPVWLYDDLAGHRARQDTQKREFGNYRDHGLVFAARNGEPLHRNNVALRRLKPLLKSAGLPAEFSLYTLRRSFASLLRRAGVSAKEVSEQMGHVRTSFTDEVYVSVYDSAKREMTNALEQMLGTHPAHTESKRVM